MLTPASKEDALSIHGVLFGWLNETSVYQAAKKQGGFQVSHMMALPGSEERVRIDYKYEGNAATKVRLELNQLLTRV